MMIDTLFPAEALIERALISKEVLDTSKTCEIAPIA